MLIKQSNYKLEFTLKQHTPIIHFQANQAGAILRATELKPKLDRFLIEHVFNGTIPDKYKINKDKDALDYKVRISPDDSQSIDIDERNSLYFAARKPKEMFQEEFNKIKKKYKKHNQDFTITFFSFNKEITNKIKEYFPSFLTIHNFGTRQNKGFGSFYISKEDENYIDPITALNKIDMYYIYAKYTSESSENILKHIEVIYPLMKSGINYPDHPKKEITLKDGRKKKVPERSVRGKKESYYKSFLFSYMLDKNPSIGNEKRFIKERFFRPDLRIEDDNITKKYVRAMLGVSEFVEFKDDRKGVIKYKSNVIERFKSPVTFKIIDDYLFLIAESMPDSIFNQEFSFKHTYRQRNQERTSQESIFTPENNEFDLKDFLNKFADYFNDDLIVDKEKDKQNIFDKKILNAKKAKFKKVKL